MNKKATICSNTPDLSDTFYFELAEHGYLIKMDTNALGAVSLLPMGNPIGMTAQFFFIQKFWPEPFQIDSPIQPKLFPNDVTRAIHRNLILSGLYRERKFYSLISFISLFPK